MPILWKMQRIIEKGNKVFELMSAGITEFCAINMTMRMLVMSKFDLET